MPEPFPADLRVAAALLGEGLAVEPGYLPEASWRALADEARRLRDHGAFRHAGVGRGRSFRVRPEIRGDHVLWLDPQRATRRQRTWLDRMEGLRRALNRELTLGLFGFEAHLAVYPPGARYHTHLDRFADASHRIVTTILYLNSDWRAEDGGVLRVYAEEPDPPPFRDVAPAGGTLVAFLAGERPHEVRPSTRERWSVVGWFTARP